MKLSLLATVVLIPNVAAAQFTTVITPPKKDPPPAVAITVAAQDSAQRAALTDMKVWVDSAATAIGVPDSAAVLADSAPPAIFTEPAPRTVERQEAPGTLPDTATPLPMIALIGSLLIGAGWWLTRTARERG